MNIRSTPFALAAMLISALVAGCFDGSPGAYQGYIEGEYVYVGSPLGGSLTNLIVARGDSVKAGPVALHPRTPVRIRRSRDGRKKSRPVQSQPRPRGIHFQTPPRNCATIPPPSFPPRNSIRPAPSVMPPSLRSPPNRPRSTRPSGPTTRKQQFAPADAQVHDTLYRQGEYVAAGNPVVVLLPPTNIKVRFFVPQEDLAQVKIGSTVSVQCDGAAHPLNASLINYISTQRAEYTPPIIYSRETRANLVFMIEATFAPADAASLRPGQPADIRLNPASK